MEVLGAAYHQLKLVANSSRLKPTHQQDDRILIFPGTRNRLPVLIPGRRFVDRSLQIRTCVRMRLPWTHQNRARIRTPSCTSSCARRHSRKGGIGVLARLQGGEVGYVLMVIPTTRRGHCVSVRGGTPDTNRYQQRASRTQSARPATHSEPRRGDVQRPFMSPGSRPRPLAIPNLRAVVILSRCRLP
jgi:hypothetical protein